MSVHVVELVLSDGLSVKWSQQAKSATLTLLVAATQPFNGALAQPFTNDVIFNPVAIPDGYDAPTWSGYADQVVTWNTVATEGVGGATIEGVSVDWQSDAATDTIIYGVILKQDGEDVVLMYHKFPEPLIVVGVQSITVVFTIDAP